MNQCVCSSCGQMFDPDEYFDDDLAEDTDICPKCYFSGDCFNDDTADDDADDLGLYEDVEEDEDQLPEDFYTDEIPDDEDFDDEEFEKFCEEQEGDYA